MKFFGMKLSDKDYEKLSKELGSLGGADTFRKLLETYTKLPCEIYLEETYIEQHRIDDEIRGEMHL